MIHIHGVHDSIHVPNILWAKDIWIISLSTSKIYTFIVVMILKILFFLLKYTMQDNLVPGTQMELETTMLNEINQAPRLFSLL
jgi:hypothetical protein